jgi:hypothetical protein
MLKSCLNEKKQVRRSRKANDWYVESQASSISRVEWSARPKVSWVKYG